MNYLGAQALCNKHTKQPVRFVCALDGCTFGNLICDQCSNSEPRHINQHKNYINSLQDFMGIQNKMTQKFIPTLTDTFKEIENRFINYSRACDQEAEEVDKDFAALFKIFFQLSESAKNFVKENLKGNQKKFQEKFNVVKKNFVDLSQSKQDSFFTMFFSKENEEIEAKTTEELIAKLIKRNSPINKIRNDCIMLSNELDGLVKQRPEYKKTDDAKQIYDNIKDSLEKQCKEMFRNFKEIIEGADQNEMKKSIFGKKPLQQQNSQVINTSTITIDLLKQSQSNLISPQSQSLKSSMVQFEKEMQIPSKVGIKKLDAFPPIKNKEVLEAIRIHGSLNLNIQDSLFKNIPEQGPFQYEDGSIYYGHILDNKRFGRGKLMFSDQAFYEGFWKNDIPFGFGRLIRANGDVYEGECIDYKAHGKGTFTTLDGQYKYIGEWNNDQKQGLGEELVKGKYEYKGEFNKGLFHGLNGVIKFADGVEYTGEFKDGQLTGQGQFTYPNGEKYYGQVQNSKKHGQGIFIWLDGRKYEGNYKDDYPDGKGLFLWTDGFIYNGNWEQGLQHGIGIEIDPDGREREGEWIKGVWQKWITK